MRDLVVAVVALAIAGGAGYFWAYQEYEPGVRFLAQWIRGGEPARSAHDPLRGPISEDPVIRLPSNVPEDWSLDIMGRTQATSEKPIREVLLKIREIVPDAELYVRIVADECVTVSNVMHVLRLCADCGYQDADVNGFAGHNYTRLGEK
jgi:hypothetical protein